MSLRLVLLAHVQRLERHDKVFSLKSINEKYWTTCCFSLYKFLKVSDVCLVRSDLFLQSVASNGRLLFVRFFVFIEKDSFGCRNF